MSAVQPFDTSAAGDGDPGSGTARGSRSHEMSIGHRQPGARLTRELVDTRLPRHVGHGTMTR